MSSIKNIATLITGTTVAQIIPIAISPILTRIYTPKDFGTLTLYISICAIFSVVATLRYELAIVQPKNDQDAKSIVIVSFILVTTISLICLIFAVIYNFFNLNILEGENISEWLYLAPASVFCVGVYNISNYWLLRESRYKDMATSKMIQGASLSVSQVSLSVIKSNGLVFGHLIGQILSTIFIFRRSSKFWKRVPNPSLKICKENIKKYKAMPLYSTPGAFADNLSTQLPVFTITYIFGTYITGIFGLTFRILNMPAALVSQAISQVVYKRVVDQDHSQDQKHLLAFIFKIFFSLLALVLPFAIVIWFFGEEIFSFLFGEEWRQAGSMASILIIAIVFRFAISPLSTVLAINENVKLGVAWQFTYLITLSSTLMFFSRFELDTFLWAFVIHEVVIYLFYLIMILIGVKRLQGAK